ncbi:MAG TPA: GntR family transcriptional regulator [Candidatus Agathobaculum pullicola]|uniref:GntR family transcriptional regulator n=1 Tax=Candidatus Agathobaculum pullicola TaxID=2838426 RepID=UPI001F87C632|nr:GntR family transcriptional regulator [Candidatus Agathobaculum pullicola]
MSTAKTSSMQSQAYEFIKRKITMCEYPPNQLLSEAVLQAELGFSRTPVREAIGRLEQEGLLKVFPKRGIVVSGFTISDISMIFEVRRLVEPYTLRNYGNRLDMDKIAEFSQIFHKHANAEEFTGFYELDDEFHSALVSVLPNEYLRDLYSRIQTQIIRLRVMSGQLIESRLQRTMAEHAEIADACLSHNWDRAALAMVQHLHFSEESSLATLLKSHSGTSII